MRLTLDELEAIKPVEGWINCRNRIRDLPRQLQCYKNEIRHGHSYCTVCFVAQHNPKGDYPIFPRVTASYGFVEGLPTRCSRHKESHMEFVRRPLCQFSGCQTLSRGGGEPYCVAHGGGIRCALCSQFSVPQHGFLCWTCRTGTDRAKQYEKMVEDCLSQHPVLHMWSYRDKTIPCSNHKRRPDFVWCLEDRVVVLEVDEHCHRYYNRPCEVTRVMEIHESCQGLPLVLLRFNPLRNDLPLLVEKLEEVLTAITPPHPLIHVIFVNYPDHRVYDLAREVEEMVNHKDVILDSIEDQSGDSDESMSDVDDF